MLKLITSDVGPRGNVKAYVHRKRGPIRVLVMWGGPGMADIIHIETARQRRSWCEAMSQILDKAIQRRPKRPKKRVLGKKLSNGEKRWAGK